MEKAFLWYMFKNKSTFFVGGGAGVYVCMWGVCVIY